MRRFECETRIAADPPVVFELSLDVGVHTSSMARSGERIVAGVSSGQMTMGDTVTWRAKHFGIPWRMTSTISAYDSPAFVDEQVAGPFRSWRHEHHVEADGDGTLLRDVIEFSAPFGPLGRLAEFAVLGRYMPALIRRRNNHLKVLAETRS